MKNVGRKLVAVTLLGIVVYAGLTLTSDVRQLRVVLGAFEPWTFGAALALASLNYALRFLKWEFYLRRLAIGAHAPGASFRPLPTGESLAIFLSGFAMSLTPGKAGEVFKSALLASARGVPIARSAPIVVADRLSDLLALIVLVAVGSASFPGYGWIALVALALVAMALFFVAAAPVTHALLDVIARATPGRALAPRLRDAYAALRAVSTPGALIAMTALSVLAWSLECAALWVLLRGLHTPTTAPLAFFAYATATIAGALAMLPGGLGGTEAVLREVLVRLGHAPLAVAAAATLLVRLATLWFAVGVGFVALAVFRRRYDRGVDRRAEGVEAAPATVAA